MKDMQIFSVCDGHGVYGHLVSNYIKDNLVNTFIRHFQPNKDPKLCIYKAFDELTRDLYKGKIDTDFSGTTSITAFIIKD